MTTIEQTLEQPAEKPAAFLLRSHRPGDIGWVISSQAKAYAEEYGWDISYEALVAEICAQFIRNYDASREHCWLAEAGGEDERQQLGLVADFSKRDGARRDQKGLFHVLIDSPGRDVCERRPTTRRALKRR